MDTKRLILFVIFSFSLLLLWDSWQRKQADLNPPAANQEQDKEIPVLDENLDPNSPNKPINSYELINDSNAVIRTDLFEMVVSSVGGDIRQLKLLHFKADNKVDNYNLFNDTNAPVLYIAQSGFSNDNLPSHKESFKLQKSSYEMSGNTLSVPLSYESDLVKVIKTYTFNKGSYLIEVDYEITNKSRSAISPKAYYQLLHDGKSNQGSVMMPSFTGTAYYTLGDKFTKLAFTDVDDETFSLNTQDGWIGMIQRYFASAWILPDGSARKFYSKKVANEIYSAGVITQLANIAPNETLNFSAKLYAGPQSKDSLVEAAPGLEYTVDYGWLTFIAAPLFSVLSGIHSMVGNWGVAIILLTFLIKLLFYPLSASSYRSMAQMRELAPRLQSMKEKFGDDKQKMQQAMMELYKTEKINPLGGCLPILIQIPVFIALYWVLLGSVEIRHAPFFGWIQDLSAIDPYFVLPILMAASMFLQTKLNPKPTDPMQARLMIMMPVIFSIFFFFFPAGLVLYWLVNNILSIAQQWYVNKKIHAEALKKKGNA